MKRNISIILFVATLVAPPIVLTIAVMIGRPEIFMEAWVANLWIFFLGSAIPIASLIFGIAAHKEGKTFRINIIAGAIVALFMIAVGSVSFAMEVDRTGAFIEEASTRTGIALPREVEPASYHFFDGRVGNALLKDRQEKAAFEQSISSDERWVKQLPPASKAALPRLLLSAAGSAPERCCLFAEPVSAFNPTSLSHGKYSLTYLAYWPSDARLFVFDSYRATL